MLFVRTSFSTILYSLVICNLLKTSGTETLYPEFLAKSNETKRLATCILKILQKFVNCNEFITVVTTGGAYSTSVTKTINEDLCYSVVLKSGDLEHWSIWTETFVVLTETSDDVLSILSELATHLHWNPRARYIVYTNEINNDKIKNIFTTLLIFNVYHVAVLSLKGHDVIIHSYDPFGNGKCGRHFEDIITFGECDNVVNSPVVFTNNKKGAFGLRNCTLKIVVRESIPCTIFKESNYRIFGKYTPGLEQYLLNNVALRENLTYRYQFSSKQGYFGLVFPNRTTTGLFSLVQEGQARMAIGGLQLMKDRAAVFDYVWGYFYENFCLFTPVLDTQPWRNIYNELSPTTWTLTLICYCIVTAIGIFISRIYQDIIVNRLLLIFKFWSFFFQANSDKHLIKIVRLRSILCCWIWLTFLISSFYSTAMFSMMTAQVETKRQFNVDNLADVPFKPCLSETTRKSFLLAFNEYLPESDSSVPECRHAPDGLALVSSSTNLYTILKKQAYLLRQHEFLNSRGEATIDVWDVANLGFIAAVVYVKKGDPIKEMLDKYAMHMFEAGLLQKQFALLSIRVRSAMRKSKRFSPVRLTDLRIPFLILSGGFVVSSAIFVLEILIQFVKLR